MKPNLLLKPVVTGLLSQVPFMQRFIHRKGTGGTCQPEYCYEVWMKHLVMLSLHRGPTVPRVVAELGPGDSLGIGFAALLSGAEQFIALDVEKYSNSQASNLAMFDQIVTLFQARSGRWKKGWPDYDAYLDERLFPSHILTEEHLAASLAPERIAKLRACIANLGAHNDDITAPVRYFVPWSDASVIDPGSVDLLFSQSVLEHVTDPAATYQAFHSWVKPGGYISHQVDFSSHSIAAYWNGHWAYSNFMWKIILGKRSYLLNLKPYSTHLHLAEQNGFEIVTSMQFEREDGLKLDQLAAVAKGFTEKDSRTASMFFQARRRI